MPPTKPGLFTALLIDHDDSFTYNVKSWLSARFAVDVTHHFDLKNRSDLKKYDLVVFSPGPKSPLDYPHSLQHLMTTRPDQHLLGICLGMQMMTLAEKGSVATYAPPLHGKTSFLQSENTQIDGRKVARYHSMICKVPQSKFELIATADGHPMWIQHKTKLWLGLQFHPESFLTENSDFYLNALADWIRQ